MALAKIMDVQVAKAIAMALAPVHATIIAMVVAEVVPTKPSNYGYQKKSRILAVRCSKIHHFHRYQGLPIGL